MICTQYNLWEGGEEGKRSRGTHPQGELGAASFHKRARDMGAQGLVMRIRAGAPRF